MNLGRTVFSQLVDFLPTSVDWLARPRPRGSYGMGAFFRSIDTIPLGRKTYDQALERTGGKGMGFGSKVKASAARRPGPLRDLAAGLHQIHLLAIQTGSPM